MDLINSPSFALRVNELLQQTHTPGLAVAILQNDTIASQGFGLAKLDQPTNMTGDTLFDIASSSKSLTAASVGLLVVDDVHHPLLKWDTPMSFLLPEDFVMSGDGYTDQVTVEDILSHRSGFPRHDFSYMSFRAEHPDTPQSVTQNLRNLPNAAPLRKKWMYSNIMFIVASWLVEKITDTPFAEFLAKNIFTPLGMNSTYLQPDAAIDAGLKERMAIPYVWQEDTESFNKIPWIQAPEAQGCGSIYTSANDYIKWVRAIMDKKAPITPELHDGLVKPRIKIEFDDDDDDPGIPFWYAAGLIIEDFGNFTLIGHDGAVSGFASMHFFIPELKLGMVLLMNVNDDSGVENTVASWLLEDVLKAAGIDDAHRIKRKRSLSSSSRDSDYELQQRLCPRHQDDGHLDIVLSAYTGQYCHSGYHCLTIEKQANELFVNATDRSNPFTATFEYACNERMFLFRMVDYYDGDVDMVAAEFEIEDGKVVRLGVQFDDEFDDYIWFDKGKDRVSGG